MARPSREGEILAAALAVFVEKGYDGARVRDIAERAGVSEAALYSHHPSKEAVAVALFETHMRRYSQEIGEIAARGQESVRARIEAIASRSLQAFCEERDAFAFVLTHQSRFIAQLPGDFPYAIRVLEALIEQGQSEGSVRIGPVRLLAALVFGCVAQPVRTVLEAPPGTIDLTAAGARELVSRAAWVVVSAARGSAVGAG